ARYHDGFASMQSHLAELAAYVDETSAEIRADVEQTGQAAGRQFEDLRASVSKQLNVLDRSLGELRLRAASLDLAIGGVERFGRDGDPTIVHPPALDSVFARLYDGFVEAFGPTAARRGAHAETYLPELSEASQLGPVLDVGCGDGWWIAQLDQAGVPAYGIDVRPRAIELARHRGVDSRLEGAHEHLAACAKGSLGAVTLLRVVEYLAIDELVQLLDLALLALKEGGILLVETLDPANAVVATSVFPQDPARRQLVPKELLSYLVRARGFGEPEIRPGEAAAATLVLREPEVAPWAADVAGLVAAVNERLLGPETYVLVARR
ncbi:MAG TPA: class I SAM-dependent methyltransferase, partial [Acidimicrobiales bacterium]|nr:class I SAM-dependent methyltransferase [Acidimicrobiales bacterium]